MYFKIYSLLGEYFGWTPHYCLHELTLGQALTYLNVKVKREREMNEELERRKAFREAGYEDPNQFLAHEYDANGDVDQLPDIRDFRAAFGGQT